MNTYRLLRDNKETGPFSLQELLSKQLKAYDLVWVENRSAAWRYPSEIEELKAYSPEAVNSIYDSFFRKSASSASTTNTTRKEKPRYRVTAVSSKIENTAAIPSQPVQQVNTTEPLGPSPEFVRPEHQAYVPSVANVSSARATFSHHNDFTDRSNENPVLETKYSASLDDIKRQYAEKILNTKKPNFFYRYAWVLIIPMLAAGIWLGYKLSVEEKTKGIGEVRKPKLENLAVTDAVKLAVTNNEVEAGEETYTATHNADVRTPEKRSVITDVRPAPVSKTKNVMTENNPTTAVVPNNSKVNDAGKQIDPQKDEFILPAPSVATGVPQSEQRQPRVRDAKPSGEEKKIETTITTTATPKSSPSKGKRVDDYVVVDGDYKKQGNGISDVAIKVENVTPYPLDLVVLDIQYFDKNGRLQKGETVYAKNIAPRRDVVVSAPNGINAHSVGYKVSLVSAEKAGLYLVAE